jgi:hypothetical protein
MPEAMVVDALRAPLGRKRVADTRRNDSMFDYDGVVWRHILPPTR